VTVSRGRLLGWAAERCAAEGGGERAGRLRLDADRILAHVLGVGRSALYTESAAPVDDAPADEFRRLLARRLAGEPLPYVLGTEFFGPFELLVDPRVLIPRPETRLLVERALSLLPSPSGACVVDLGTGSGNIALCMAAAGCGVLATDVSAEALELAEENWRRVGLDGAITGLCGDLYGPLEACVQRGSCDAVLCNPPYVASGELAGLQPEVRFEPRLALDGGPDGLDLIRRLVAGAAEWLRAGGYLVLEIGAGQGEAVRCLVEAEAGLEFLGVEKDRAGIPRVVSAARR